MQHARNMQAQFLEISKADDKQDEQKNGPIDVQKVQQEVELRAQQEDEL